MQSNLVQQTEKDRGPFSPSQQLVTCRVDELQPHPSYLRHRIAVQLPKLSALAQRGESAFREPLAITQDQTILDGYARWELARKRGRLTLLCIEYDLTEAQALHWMLQKHHRSAGLNAYSRTLLAMDLEPWFKEKALSNQQVGGRNKGSSKLTEAERLDVRSEIAAAAGISVGNVSKVKQLRITADPEILQALHRGEISIHRAWTWSKEHPEKQRDKFWQFQSQRGVKKSVQKLISRHRPKALRTAPCLDDLIRGLMALESCKNSSIAVQMVKVPGMTVFVSEELYRALRFRQESTVTCA